MKTDQREFYRYGVFIVSLVAMLGSLYFSEILHLPPCVLCWYQRAMMYPTAFISAVGALRKDNNLPYYVLPLSVVGFFVGLYHNLLYYHILPESAAPCSAGVSCTVKLIEWFGFVTIPLLSFIAFTIILALTVVVLRKGKNV